MKRFRYTLKQLIAAVTALSLLIVTISMIMNDMKPKRYTPLVHSVRKAITRLTIEHLNRPFPTENECDVTSMNSLLVSGPSPVLDAWGRPLRYLAPYDTDTFIIRSAGEDGLFDTDDDIDTGWR